MAILSFASLREATEQTELGLQAATG